VPFSFVSIDEKLPWKELEVYDGPDGDPGPQLHFDEYQFGPENPNPKSPPPRWRSTQHWNKRSPTNKKKQIEPEPLSPFQQAIKVQHSQSLHVPVGDARLSPANCPPLKAAGWVPGSLLPSALA